MPRSKRAKKVTLSKTSKKEPQQKRSGYVDALRRCVESRSSIFAVRIGANIRPTRFKQLRAALPPGTRVFLGKRSLMRIALGTSPEDEIRPELHRLGQTLRGGDALIATDDTRARIDAVLRDAVSSEFATAGFVPQTTVTLEADTALPFAASSRDELTALGVQTTVRDAKLYLLAGRDFQVATPNEPLSPEQAKLLKHLDVKLDTFKPTIIAAWVDGTFSSFGGTTTDADADDDDDDDVDEGPSETTPAAA